MQEKILTINNLSVHYQTPEGVVNAVNGIDLSIDKGEVLGLVGETGAGKTSTAMAVMRLLNPRNTELCGSITFKDNDIMKLSKEDIRQIRGNRMAMIFQDPMTTLNPVFTVERQIKEVLKNHNRLPKREMDARVDLVLSMVGIDPRRKNDYPHQFSGGMKQRVVIAMALALEPDLIIADEPTTALDVTIQLQVLQLIRNLRQKLGTSMLLITHDLGVVAEMCGSVAVMYAGSIVEYGCIEDVFNLERRHHPYTTGLFRSIPDMEVKTRRLSPIDGLMPDPRNLPEGCPFHTRCGHCYEPCTHEKPRQHMEAGHMIACHLYRKEGI